jgi:chaperonin GroES
MKLNPLSDRVVVKQVEAEETTKAGIILTSAARRSPRFLK